MEMQDIRPKFDKFETPNYQIHFVLVGLSLFYKKIKNGAVQRYDMGIEATQIRK